MPRHFVLLLSMLLLTGVQAAPRHAAGIASAHPLATRAGFEILEAGGNAFDAAVAVSAVLAVVEPYSSGLGGGGFWLLQRAGGKAVMIDGRETAPLAAHEKMYQNEAGEAVFLRENAVPPEGHVIRQPDLARTLEALASQGTAGFYRGEVAKRLVAASRAAGGIWTLADLAGYRVKERQPVSGRWYDYRITSAAPPSSGGIALVEMLNMLANDGLASLPGIRRKHLLIEAMRRAYRDRAEFLGDPDFVAVPQARLTGRAHARRLRARISLTRATPSRELAPVAPPAQGHHTTHFSILDAEGNRVAATLSINYPFGSGFVAAGTGVLLNDEMDDFSARPGVPNVYGLVGAQANAIAPGKRMLSSMSPTFVEGPDRLVILGTPGGSRIITMVLQGILAASEGASAKRIVGQPRFHHQYLPDEVQFEPGAFSKEEQAGLQRLGHRLKPLGQRYGNMQVVILDKASGRLDAASDPRGEGLAQVREIR